MPEPRGPRQHEDIHAGHHGKPFHHLPHAGVHSRKSLEGVNTGAGQWFNWVIWFAIIGELAVWAGVMWVMAIRTLL